MENCLLCHRPIPDEMGAIRLLRARIRNVQVTFKEFVHQECLERAERLIAAFEGTEVSRKEGAGEIAGAFVPGG